MAELASSDGLVRWLVGGLVAGAVMLGLLVGAYEIGYHHAHQKVGTASATANSPPTTTNAASPATTTTTPSSLPAAALGKQLFSADGCSSCHSLTGSAGAGPALNGVAGSSVQLSDGTTVTADDAYLTTSITDPDAEIVSGYQKGIMSSAISSFGLSAKPMDVAALVAFITSQR